MKQRNESTQKRSTKNKIFYLFVSVVLLVLLFFITYKLSLQIYKQNQVDDEVEGLQVQIDQLNRDNDDFDELISYLQTDDFKEKEAKDKLNLIKEGEKLVLVKESRVQEEENLEIPKEAEVVVHHKNYYYWWHYFFSLKK